MLNLSLILFFVEITQLLFSCIFPRSRSFFDIVDLLAEVFYFLVKDLQKLVFWNHFVMLLYLLVYSLIFFLHHYYNIIRGIINLNPISHSIMLSIIHLDKTFQNLPENIREHSFIINHYFLVLSTILITIWSAKCCK